MIDRGGVLIIFVFLCRPIAVKSRNGIHKFCYLYFWECSFLQNGASEEYIVRVITGKLVVRVSKTHFLDQIP
jgi:hypothetical protein